MTYGIGDIYDLIKNLDAMKEFLVSTPTITIQIPFEGYQRTARDIMIDYMSVSHLAEGIANCGTVVSGKAIFGNGFGGSFTVTLTDYNLEYAEGAGRFNMGQYSNFILLPMLKSGLLQINSWQPKNIQDYCFELGKPLFKCLEKLGIQFESEAKRAHHLFGIPLDESINLDILKNKMAEERLILSFRGNNLRVALHLFNNKEDINALIRVLEVSKILD